jgi:hypothetical protein
MGKLLLKNFLLSTLGHKSAQDGSSHQGTLDHFVMVRIHARQMVVSKQLTNVFTL